jgi:hypothetical protein
MKVCERQWYFCAFFIGNFCTRLYHILNAETIVITSYPYVYANERIDDCLGRIKDYSEDPIPVLDSAVVTYYGLAWIFMCNVFLL